MKKKSIILSIFASLALLWTSCDMNEIPTGSIATEEAISSAKDCKAFREGLYASMRGYLAGSHHFATEVHVDELHALTQYGNNYGVFYRWEAEASDGAFSGCFSFHYSLIANANFLIQESAKLLEDPEISDEDKAAIRVYSGEAYFIRAYCYYELVQRFCKDYDVATAASEMGMPLVSRYEPTADAGKYPARASLKDTYDFIMKDIQEAEKLVTTKGAVNANYATSDAVKVLKARVALQMEDYATAAQAAEVVIGTGTYTLMSDKDAFAEMWLKDNGTEPVWQIAMTLNELGNGTYGGMLMGIVDELPKPSYVPESGVLNLYDKVNDIRYDAYFKTDTADVNMTEPQVITFVCKFPGNPELYTSKTNYVNRVKPMRISELYLIAAEAYAMQNNLDQAADRLNALKAARIEGFTAGTYTSATILKEIQDERRRELYLEGFRYNDMKRWKMDVKRTAPQSTASYFYEIARDLTKSHTDDRFLWAIPQNELDANPQIKGQQNPGY